MLRVRRSVTIRRSREAVYRIWRNFKNFPEFMHHVKSVTPLEGDRSHWVASAPAGREVEWYAELVEDLPLERIAWRTAPESEVRHEGTVEFADAPGDRGTELHVELIYDPPGGRAGAGIAELFGEEPEQQIRDDLRRLKQVLETGEVVLSDGSPQGAGQGVSKQRAAQPMASGAVS